MIDVAIRNGLPLDVGSQIVQDYERIGLAVAKLDPSSRIAIKLDIMGKNSCRRWHRDHYKGRAVVSYNSCATEYIDHQYVDFWELENCGNDACIISDPPQIIAADLGDVLFMKGLTFPSDQSGLVHRSPPRRFHQDGSDAHRLLLKVDLM